MYIIQYEFIIVLQCSILRFPLWNNAYQTLYNGWINPSPLIYLNFQPLKPFQLPLSRYIVINYNLNFYPLEVVSRYRDPQLQVGEIYPISVI